MSVLGIPQIAVVHGISVAGKFLLLISFQMSSLMLPLAIVKTNTVNFCTTTVYAFLKHLNQAEHMSLQWPMRT